MIRWRTNFITLRPVVVVPVMLARCSAGQRGRPIELWALQQALLTAGKQAVNGGQVGNPTH